MGNKNELHYLSFIDTNHTVANGNLAAPCPVCALLAPCLPLGPSAALAPHVTLIYSLPHLPLPMKTDQGCTSVGLWLRMAMSVIMSWHTPKKTQVEPIWICTPRFRD